MNERASPRSRSELEAVYAGAIASKRWDDAARVARELGHPREAAALFRRAGNTFFAGLASYEAQDKAGAIDSFVAVPRDHRLYRVACVHVVRIASELGRMDLSVDTFLTHFVRTAPENAREAEALGQLAGLYEEADMLDDAVDMLERVRAFAGDEPGSRERISALRRKLSGTTPPPRPGEGESTFWRRGPVASAPPPPMHQPAPSAVAATLVSAPSAPAHVPLQSPLQVHAVVQAVVQAAAQPLPQMPVAASEPQLLGDRYRVEATLGRGGTATVYQALDLELGERVAVKLFAEEQHDPSMLRRFKQELVLSRRLSHPNVVRLYDLGMHAGRRFLTMELLEGTDLRAWLKAHRPSPLVATRFARQICAGLGAAHRLGIIHRDLKPENVFMTTGGVLKLMDFGLAKREADADNLTVSGFFAGTPGYVAPEQITDFSTATYAADLYSFGVFLYEMLVGARPFVHKERSQIMRMHLVETPVAPTTRAPHLPAEVDAIVLRLLQKDPAARFGDCAELDAQLALLEARCQAP